MAGLKKLRYSCLTADQQQEFDSWNTRQRQYALFRSQGMDKANAYRAAGYKCRQAGQNGYLLENRGVPRMKEIISALSCQYKKFDALKEGTEISKKIDEKAKEIRPEMLAYLTKVPVNSPIVENQPLDIDNITGEQARDIQFYRQIADGTMKSVTITRKYDKDNKLISKTIVESSDLDIRIKAQREVMRKIGIADVLEIGSVEANNINIMIVDASKKEEKQDERNTINGEIKEVDGELALVKEIDEKA